MSFDGEHVKTCQNGEIICLDREVGRNERKWIDLPIVRGELTGLYYHKEYC